MKRNHHLHVTEIYELMRQAVRSKPDHEPIEVATAALLLALHTAEKSSRHPANIAVGTLLEDLWEVYVKNN